MRVIELIIRVILIVVFVLSAAIVVVEGRGWRLNRTTLRFQKTGTLVLRFSPEDARVSVNAEVMKKKSPVVVNQLLPGRYEVSLTKEGYHPWSKTVTVDPERVEAEIGILLFREKPVIELVTDQDEAKQFDQIAPLVLSPKGRPMVKNVTEIWVDEQLISRFSQPVLRAEWLLENEYIVFQLGATIHAIHVDGTNDITLLSLSSAAPTAIEVNRRSSEILYKDGAVLKRATLR